MVAVVAASSAKILIASYQLAESYSRHTAYVSDEIYYVDAARRLLRDMAGFEVNESMFSNKTGSDYYNLEHPPLGKYIIALSIALCGDTPICWRAPGIVEASLIPAIVALGIYSGRRGSVGALAASAAALALAAEPSLYRAAAVAMLDIHLAFFTALALALAAAGRARAAALAGGLAASVKMSGAAAVLGVAIVNAYSSRPGERARAASEAVIIALVVYAASHLPLLVIFSPARLVDEVIAALSWHTTPRPEGPPTSTPIGWILNSNPFYYTFAPAPVAAVTNTTIQLYALAASIVAPLLAGKRGLVAVAGPAFHASVFAVYALVMALGNTTLYSFYAVQLAPSAAASVAASVVMAAGWHCFAAEHSRPRGAEGGYS